VRFIYLSVGGLIVAGTIIGFFYWGSALLLQSSDLSPYDRQSSGIHELLEGISTGALNSATVGLIFICSTALGIVVGPFLIPIAFRPFVSPATFWRWHRADPSMNMPVVSALHEKWCAVFFGKKSS
jgi:hypothetical protein